MLESTSPKKKLKIESLFDDIEYQENVAYKIRAYRVQEERIYDCFNTYPRFLSRGLLSRSPFFLPAFSLISLLHPTRKQAGIPPTFICDIESIEIPMVEKVYASQPWYKRHGDLIAATTCFALAYGCKTHFNSSLLTYVPTAVGTYYGADYIGKTADQLYNKSNDGYYIFNLTAFLSSLQSLFVGLAVKIDLDDKKPINPILTIFLLPGLYTSAILIKTFICDSFKEFGLQPNKTRTTWNTAPCGQTLQNKALFAFLDWPSIKEISRKNRRKTIGTIEDKSFLLNWWNQAHPYCTKEKIYTSPYTLLIEKLIQLHPDLFPEAITSLCSTSSPLSTDEQLAFLEKLSVSSHMTEEQKQQYNTMLIQLKKHIVTNAKDACIRRPNPQYTSCSVTVPLMRNNFNAMRRDKKEMIKTINHLSLVPFFEEHGIKLGDVRHQLILGCSLFASYSGNQKDTFYYIQRVIDKITQIKIQRAYDEKEQTTINLKPIEEEVKRKYLRQQTYAEKHGGKLVWLSAIATCLYFKLR